MDQDDQDEILNRLDERTKLMHDSLSRFEKRLDRQQREIKRNRELAQTNDTKIKLGAFLGGSAITALATKIVGIFTI